MANSNHSRLPDFLVIGGMKCATTTLHQDLSKHPDIYCGQKELNALVADSDEAVLEAYSWNYRQAPPKQLLGDVSTHYSMLQEYPQASSVASKLLGSDLRIIYIVREPIARALSHHQHMMNVINDAGMGPDVNLEIRKSSLPIDYSCYAQQLQPWLDLYGKDRTHVVKFEDYISNRQTVLNDVFAFLGVQAQDVAIDPEGANRSHSRFTNRKVASKMWGTRAFQRLIKPCLPVFLKPMLRSLFMKKAQLTSIPPTDETIEFIYDGVKEDVQKLQQVLGLDEPLWELEAVWEKQISR